MDDSQSISGVTRRPLTLITQIGYVVGHILNDLCSSCWFTYFLIYFTKIMAFSPASAGTLMLIGQVADGLCTPLVGILIDKVNFRYGKRKTWHAIGSVSVAVSFGFVFHKCLGCENSSYLEQMLYYSAFILIFQFGWAATQISHLSLIPVLTVDRKKIVLLNSFRTGLTFISGIVVYCIMWMLLRTSDSKTLSHKDDVSFNHLAYSVICIGSVFTIVFHCLVREATDEELEGQLQETEALIKIEPMTVKSWFYMPQFYLIALMYVCTRMACNIPQVYIPLYLTKTLRLDKEAIAYYPLMILVCSVVGSFICRFTDKRMGHKFTYLCGGLVTMGASAWFYFQDREHAVYTYGAAAMIGVGTSSMLILSLSMTADLVGVHTKSGSFVYGAMSLCDKIGNGIVIALVQQFHPADCDPSAFHCPVANYYRYTVAFIPGGAAVVGSIAIVMLLMLRARQQAERTKVTNVQALLRTESENSLSNDEQ